MRRDAGFVFGWGVPLPGIGETIWAEAGNIFRPAGIVDREKIEMK